MNNISLEHILPQSSKDKFVRKIGNIIPLDNILNNKIGNISFHEKLDYFAESKLKLV